MMKALLIVAQKDFQPVEYKGTRDELEAAGISVTVASFEEGDAIDKEGGKIKVDISFKDVNVEDYDAVVLIGGPGTVQLIGNSDVEEDIAEIIKFPKKGNWDKQEEMWNERASEKLKDLHKEMQIVLQIVLSTLSFKIGLYKKKDKYGSEWEFVK